MNKLSKIAAENVKKKIEQKKKKEEKRRKRKEEKIFCLNWGQFNRLSPQTYVYVYKI